MRLLHTTGDGRLGWTEDLIGDKIPPYAILSHTWKEGQEVTFADLKDLDNAVDVDTQRKEGYRKIRFCAQQAKRDGLDYFWVDTCCIDKANNTELSRAINSMFRWYQNAERCYVFLSDVANDTSEIDSKSALKQSRWFKRGWTLQELLAPRSVEFFSRHGARLGDKESFKHTIHEVTGIPIEALSGSDLSEFDVAKRFSWAANRQTTEEEDGAYCLFGIFGVHLPLIYGEGKDNALERLRSAAILKHKGRSQDQEEKLGKIRSWLSAPDPSTNYHKAHKQRQAETGVWLLEGEQFTRWRERAASRLWLYGIPGCGKTILSSTIIEHLLQYCHDDTSMVMAYFYFDFNDTQKQDPELMLRSLLCQLLESSVGILKGVDALFSSCENGKRQPLLHALLQVTKEAAQEFKHVYVVLDALDECAQRSELMDMLETVAGWQLDNLHLLMTSRKERDIESSLEEYIRDEDTVCLQRDVVDKDIRRYVQQRLRVDKGLAKWNKDASVRQEIEAALMRGARGMFRWAVCQLDTLRECCNRAMLRKSLASLPRTLDQTYDRILSAISDEHSNYAIRILQWLTFSARPLSVEEVAEVVAIDAARDPAFDRDEVLEDPLEVLDICSSLVTITTNEVDRRSGSAQRIVALAHYSVQEYLVSDRIKQGSAKQYSIQKAACQSAITRGSLKYLMQLQQPLERETLQVFALARYSAKFWSSHLRKTEDEGEQASQLAASLMAKEQPAYFNWIRLHDLDHPWEEPDLEKSADSIPMPLYYAALLGLSTVTKLLFDKGAEVNAQGGAYGNALQAASYGSHERVVEMLLNTGANVNAQGGVYGNALQAASARGHEQVVKTLLDTGAEGGHEQVVKTLLDTGAEVNAQGGVYGNALQAASYGGHEQVVKTLLDTGAEVNAQGGVYGNALQAASYGGHEQVVKTLLDTGAEVNAQGGEYGKALQAASFRGHREIVTLLLDRGAQTNALGEYYGNVLQAASFGGHKDLVKLLISRLDITLQSQDLYGRTLLWWAAAGGDIATIETLIRQYNFDPREPDKFGRTPFWIATKKGHDAASKLLWEECEETSTERPAPTKIDNNQRGILCDVCTSRTIAPAFHYHCCLCAGGDWDMCEDCKASGACCADAAHILVKRTMKNEELVQVAI
ncbi:unnamed protein product [Alternaria alternata]